MKTEPLMKNTLFKINLGFVIFMTFGVIYWYWFIIWDGSEAFLGAMVANAAILGLWLVYFVSIAFLPLTRIIGSSE